MLRRVATRYICARCVHSQLQSRAQRSWRQGSSLQAGHARPGSSRAAPAENSVLSLLEERGYVNQIAGDRNILDKLLREKNVGFYAGIDPTAPSLHLGHLLPLMVLFWVHIHGHHAVSLVGGATAKIGDPSGRLTSRAATAKDVQKSNSKAMSRQTKTLWSNARQYAQRHGYQLGEMGKLSLLDNSAWLQGLSVLDFLKTLGSGMRMGAMLGRDTVKNKMEKGDGMSFAEFTYPLLQAWDWWHMYQTMQVQIQVGGSDQFGNIVAGIDAISWITQNHSDSQAERSAPDGLQAEQAPMGLTVPLLTTASGEKFGKSAGNAIWLDRSMTSPFDLYGFLLRSSDADVERYLKLFTFIPSAQISERMAEHNLDPGKRKAQHLLASELLEVVHGREEAEKTLEEHRAMRSPSLASLLDRRNSATGDKAGKATTDTPRIMLPKSLVFDTSFPRILYHAGLAASKSEGARSVAKGGVYVATSSQEVPAAEHDSLRFVQVQGQTEQETQSFVKNGLLVLRLGKWKVRVIEVIEDAVFDQQEMDAPGWAEWKSRSNGT